MKPTILEPVSATSSSLFLTALRTDPIRPELGFQSNHSERRLSTARASVIKALLATSPLNNPHPRRLILLGDVKHAVAKVELEEWKYVPEFFESLVEMIPDVQVVPGNHDGNLEPLTPPSVKISTSEGISIWNKVGLFHGHAWPSPPLLGCEFLVMGHLHPVVVFKDPLGFRITRQSWVRAKSNGQKLAEGVLKHESVKWEGDSIEEYKKKFGITVVDAE